MQKYILSFTRLLLKEEQFSIETPTARYSLHTGISEYYILLNLTPPAKKDGRMLISIEEQKGKPILCPVAILQNEQTIWITVTDDEQTNYPSIPEDSLLSPFVTKAGEEYPGGFIDATRTALSYKDLMFFEKYLHQTNYVTELWNAWQKNTPVNPTTHGYTTS